MCDPSKLALAILDAHWPEQSIPVNPAAIAERMGILVRKVELPNEVSGALVRADGKFSILIQDSDHFNRQRFTCAHEIGHFVDRDDSDAEPEEKIDFRDDVSGWGTDPREVFANQFAAELLMPGWAVRQHSKRLAVPQLARLFNVSPSAMEHRLKNLGIA